MTRPAARLHRLGGRLRRDRVLRRVRGRRGGRQVDPVAAAARLAARPTGTTSLLTREPGDTEVGAEAPRRSCSTRPPATSRTAPRRCSTPPTRPSTSTGWSPPALARGAVVVTDRYVDSTLAYQGAGRALADREVERVARWATGDLRPHLTVLLDLPPQQGLTRFEERDRIEARVGRVPRAGPRDVPAARRRLARSTTSSWTPAGRSRRSPRRSGPGCARCSTRPCGAPSRPPPPEQIRDASAEQEEPAERQGVRARDPLQPGRREVERALDRR